VDEQAILPGLKSALGDGNYLIAGQANAVMKPKMVSRILNDPPAGATGHEQISFSSFNPRHYPKVSSATGSQATREASRERG
jgi:hypothetical protein